MRTSFLAFTLVALFAAATFGASAFNYAQLQGRTVLATIVTDDNGYISIATQDAQYACYVAYTNGKIDVTWDAGSSCAGTGTGVNPYSTYYFHDVLKITNKGTKTLTKMWLNMSTDTVITINTKSTSGSMATGDTYAQNVELSTNLAVGNSWYVGYKIDASTKDTTNSPLSRTMTIEARGSN